MADLLGYVRISKRIRQHAIWQRPDYAIAWIDLIILANDQPREFFIKGKAVRVERGQLAWSLKSLEKEWGKSRDWIGGLMNFLKDHDMVKVDSDHCRTIITVLNYAAYNPSAAEMADLKGTEQGTEPTSEQGTEPTSEQGTEQGQKLELGTGNKKGEAPPRHLAETPSDEEIQSYCEAFQDLARALKGIPEGWWRGWVANRLVPNPALNKDWRRALRNDFLRDVVRRHPSAFAGASTSAQAGPLTVENEKKAAALAGRSISQARFETSRELRDVRDRLEAEYQNDQPGEPGDRALEKELMAIMALLED